MAWVNCQASPFSKTYTNSKNLNGIGTGSFTCSITSLTSGTVYYVRAYATNSIGTSYGDQLTFLS